jgi:hypothetical protein
VVLMAPPNLGAVSNCDDNLADLLAGFKGAVCPDDLVERKHLGDDGSEDAGGEAVGGSAGPAGRQASNTSWWPEWARDPAPAPTPAPAGLGRIYCLRKMLGIHPVAGKMVRYSDFVPRHRTCSRTSLLWRPRVGSPWL